MSSASATTSQFKETIDQWLERLPHRSMCSAEEVQNLMFELYDDAKGTAAQAIVEQTLTATISGRTMYGADEVKRLIEQIASLVGE